jgi:glycosyltransferase involved in cell wall biosynthesis
MIKTSLIISYYNRTDYLKLILAALERQIFKDFEIIIADDGSTEENIRQIEKLTPQIPYSLIHLWHEDKGFRKNIILNRAILTARSDYLIFIDGDCIPHSEFIREHYENRRKKTCLTGRRVNLSQKITNELTEQRIKEGYLEESLGRLFVDSIKGNTTDAEKGIYIKSSAVREYINRKPRGILGCNFSIYKDDMLDINGFDERYLAPSIGEDSDIQYRLELNGVKTKSMNNIAVQYHLYHKIQPRLQVNLDLFEAVKKEARHYTAFGIKHLSGQQ